MPKSRKITDEQARALVERLRVGESQAMLARELGVDRHTIGEAVRAIGYRPPRRALTDAQEREVARRYAAGDPCTALAGDFGVSEPTILAAVREHGVAIRKKGVIDPDTKAKMIAAWESGTSVHQLIQQFGLHGNTVRRRLREWGYEIESRYNRPRKFTLENEAEITRLYMSGVLPKDLEQRFKCSRLAITDIVRRNGGIVRSVGGRWRRWSDDDIAEMARRWNAGESQESIAKSYGTHQTRVSRLLRDAGYNPRKRIERGPDNANFKGRIVGPRGYIWVYVPEDSPFASMRNSGGYVPEHRLVMAQKLGRPLKRSEHVHHIDGNKQNNEDANLQLIQRHHGQGVRYRCRCCGSTDVEAIEFDVA